MKNDIIWRKIPCDDTKPVEILPDTEYLRFHREQRLWYKIKLLIERILKLVK